MSTTLAFGTVRRFAPVCHPIVGFADRRSLRSGARGDPEPPRRNSSSHPPHILPYSDPAIRTSGRNRHDVALHSPWHDFDITLTKGLGEAGDTEHVACSVRIGASGPLGEQ